jgi:hypothetical protein
MSEIDDLEAYATPDRARIGSVDGQKKFETWRNQARNARERMVMRNRRFTDEEADAVYARVKAEIAARKP